MEDLFKILPLTVMTKSDKAQKSLYLQFDSLTDVTIAQQILTLILKGSKGKKGEKSITKTFIQKLAALICCKKQSDDFSSCDTSEVMVTPEKKANELFHESVKAKEI